MQNKKEIQGLIQLNENGFAVVKTNLGEYQINNWYGIKKHFNITKKDLPISCVGTVNQFTGKLFNTRYKTKNFIIKSITKPC